MAEPETKHDRQLRIWGEQGQAALEKSSICLLNYGPTGFKTFKNLVLGGVGSVTVVDGSKLELGDLGNNFMESPLEFTMVLRIIFFKKFRWVAQLATVVDDGEGDSCRDDGASEAGNLDDEDDEAPKYC